MNIESSLARVLACVNPSFAERFYKALLLRYPQFAYVFRNTNMQTQRAMLPVALQMLVNWHRHPTPSGEDYLKTLGRKHQSLGIQPVDFQHFGEVLIEELVEFHGSDWTPCLAEQWQTVYDAGTRLMVEGLTDVDLPGNQLEMLSALVINASVRSEELRHLHELVEQINRGLALEDVLSYVYETFRDLIPYNRIGFATINQKKNTAVARWVMSDRAVSLGCPYEAKLEGSTLARIVETRQPRVISDLCEYLRVKPKSHSTRLIVEEGMRSSLTCPLIAHGRPVGFVFFSSIDVGAYNDAHIQLFQHIAGELSVIVEKALLYSTLKEQGELIEARNREFELELKLARELQRSMIPRHDVEAEGLAIGFVYDPVMEIGGDFLDIISLEDGRTILFLADAMGHGVRGAMIMAVTKAALHNAVRETDEPALILGQINRQLFQVIDGVFVTAVCIKLDPLRHSLKVASAGHPFPWHFRVQDCRSIQEGSTGIALGITESPDYPTASGILQKRDTLIVCTDGVFEAQNAQGRQYGDERIADLLQRYAAEKPQEISQRIYDDVKRHRGSASADDDISLVAVQIL